MSEQITTLTLFRFEGFAQRLWAFGMMQFAHNPLQKVQGLAFYKLMGTGKARFNPLPDWGTYGILQVWDLQQHAEDFFENKNGLFQRYQNKASGYVTYFMKNIGSKGEWSGGNPFIKTKEAIKEQRIAVITRATIKPKLLYKFWKYVPQSQTHLWDNPGLLYTKGIGEAPFTQMATFSIWKSLDALKEFAYKGAGHKEAIKKTRQLDWYKEELFARFSIEKILGSLEEIQHAKEN